MRAAILEFAFSGLGAEVALSAAFSDNPASLAVSRALGYEDNGEEIVERRGLPAEQIHLRLTRERWEQRERPRVELEGVEACREFFGV
jgi:RimJ/RimL family protein N-acetyltransferase